MKDNIWAKAATGAFGLLAVLAGWGLNEVYNVKMNVVRIETKLDIWMTPTPRPATSARLLLASSMPLRGAPATEFAQKSMLRAADQILHKDCDGALKTLFVGLDQTGLLCWPAGETVECK
jgi:hypothetical protein